jgi:hypothetical protein
MDLDLDVDADPIRVEKASEPIKDPAGQLPGEGRIKLMNGDKYEQQEPDHGGDGQQ